jgi:hypothetical protein
LAHCGIHLPRYARPNAPAAVITSDVQCWPRTFPVPARCAPAAREPGRQWRVVRCRRQPPLATPFTSPCADPSWLKLVRTGQGGG